MPIGGQHVRETLATQLFRKPADTRSATHVDQRFGIHLEQHPLGHEIPQWLGVALELDASLRMAEGDPGSLRAKLVEHPVEAKNARGRGLDQQVGPPLAVRGQLQIFPTRLDGPDQRDLRTADDPDGDALSLECHSHFLGARCQLIDVDIGKVRAEMGSRSQRENPDVGGGPA